jgi:galactose-1-phosphate uridylyltransferase
MTDAEATSIGPILTKITSAIQAALGTRRVYMVLFGEAIPHLHILLAGIDPSAPAEHRGPGFQTYSGVYADPVAAEAAAARIRVGLGKTG